MSVSASPGALRRVATACALAAAATAVLAGSATAAEPPNLALPANGGSATASGALGSYPVAAVNDGRRQTTSGYWNDDTQNVFPDWVQVGWASARQVSKVVLRLPVAGHLTAAQRTMARLTSSTGMAAPGRRSERPTASPTRSRAGSRRPRRPATRPAASTSRR